MCVFSVEGIIKITYTYEAAIILWSLLGEDDKYYRILEPKRLRNVIKIGFKGKKMKKKNVFQSITKLFQVMWQYICIFKIV